MRATIIASGCMLAMLLIPSFTHAQQVPFDSAATHNPTRFTNENWLTLPHPKVAMFTVLPDGTMQGSTVNGIPFTQYSIPNSFGIRVQRFEIQDHYHYIIEGEIAYSFEELSVLLTRAYQEKSIL